MLELIIETNKIACTQCDTEYPSTEKYFYKIKTKTKSRGDHYRLSSWCKECTKKNNRKWYVNNPNKVKASSDKYASQEYVKERRRKRASQAREEGKQKEWRHNNRDKISQYNKDRIMHKEHDITDQEWLECLEFFNDSCAYCGIPEANALKEQGHLLHKEHVEHNGANDITNCVPACRSCNSQKWEFEFNEWYNRDNPVFSKRRYNKIIKWLLSFTN